jgi:hypothetical protein
MISNKGHIHIVSFIIFFVFVFGIWSIYNSFKTNRLRQDLITMVKDSRNLATSIVSKDEQLQKYVNNLFIFMEKAIKNHDRWTFKTTWGMLYKMFSDLPQTQQKEILRKQMREIQDKGELIF